MTASIANATGGDGTDIGAFEVQASCTAIMLRQVQPPRHADRAGPLDVPRGVVPVKIHSDPGRCCNLRTPATRPQSLLARTARGVIGQVNKSVHTARSSTQGSTTESVASSAVYNLNARALVVRASGFDILIDGQVVGSATFGLN